MERCLALRQAALRRRALHAWHRCWRLLLSTDRRWRQRLRALLRAWRAQRSRPLLLELFGAWKAPRRRSTKIYITSYNHLSLYR